MGESTFVIPFTLYYMFLMKTRSKFLLLKDLFFIFFRRSRIKLATKLETTFIKKYKGSLHHDVEPSLNCCQEHEQIRLLAYVPIPSRK